MKSKLIIMLVSSFAIGITACTNEPAMDESIALDLKAKTQQNSNVREGNTQISGIGYYADSNDCDYESQGAEFALKVTGDLEGCLYVFVEDYGCSPSGTYRESGMEYFVGTYNDEEGTFWTNYKFEAKYEGCEDGFFVGAEIFGRCQHPLVNGSGTGVFDGATGRIDFKDNVDTGEFPYKGHIKF